MKLNPIKTQKLNYIYDFQIKKKIPFKMNHKKFL
jgi:hypothetical protein